MQLTTKLINDSPKLAWVAVVPAGDSNVTVYHGPLVETSNDWCVEAVWPGRFEEGQFDRTDLIFGTGVRRRENEVVFVSAASTVDRLWHHFGQNTWHVSNSLPALLAVSGRTLAQNYLRYRRDLHTIVNGLNLYVRTLATDGEPVHPVYFNNLVYDGASLREVAKPSTAVTFECFDAYERFLFESAELIGSNQRAPGRRFKIDSLVALSTGYDSSTAAVIAKRAGCTRAVTLRKARSLVSRSDSGHRIADALGLECRVYDQGPRHYRREESFWAALGDPQDLNLSIFDYPAPVALLFTGFHGDKVWDRVRHDLSEPLVRGDTSGLGFCEFRLLQGVIHCPVGFWGVRLAEAIQAITRSPEMDAWTLKNDYDRPIARRIVETAGVSRSAFGRRKKATTVLVDEFRWPLSGECRRRFERYLRVRGVGTPPAWLFPTLNGLGSVMLTLRERLRLKNLFRHSLFAASEFAFQWSVQELTDECYRRWKPLQSGYGREP